MPVERPLLTLILSLILTTLNLRLQVVPTSDTDTLMAPSVTWHVSDLS